MEGEDYEENEGEMGNESEAPSQISFRSFKSNMPKGLESYVLGCVCKCQFEGNENENMATLIKNNLDLDNQGFYFLCVQIKDINAGFSFAYGSIADYYLRIELNKSDYLIFAKKIRRNESSNIQTNSFE